MELVNKITKDKNIKKMLQDKDNVQSDIEKEFHILNRQMNKDMDFCLNTLKVKVRLSHGWMYKWMSLHYILLIFSFFAYYWCVHMKSIVSGSDVGDVGMGCGSFMQGQSARVFNRMHNSHHDDSSPDKNSFDEWNGVCTV